MGIGWGLGVLPSVFFFHIVGDAGQGRDTQREGSDLSDTSSPSFRSESQYSKLPSADKKK